MKKKTNRLLGFVLVFGMLSVLFPSFEPTAKAVRNGCSPGITGKAVSNQIWTNPFQDISEQDWYYDSVKYVCANGLFNGMTQDTFSPERSMTRAMAITVLFRMSGDSGSFDNSFSDIPSGSWYEQPVAWAAANCIVNGMGDNMFVPEGKVTREQLAVMLHHYAEYMGYDVSIGKETNILSYNDAFSISDYSYSALQWACWAGILEGDGSGNLNPKGSATRAETAAMLQRFIENVTS